MCRCVLEWVPDPEVTGAHNMIPVQTDVYIRALEGRLRSLGADSFALQSIKEACGGLTS